MKTLLLKDSETRSAGKIIKEEGLVVFPTETVYGIGANAFSKNACEKIFIAKGRPQDNPLIVHIYEQNQIYTVAKDFPPKTFDLIEAFWPGPLTLVLPKKETIPDVVTAGLDTVGVRLPNHKTALSFFKEAAVPIAAPSANISGKPSPTTYKMAITAMQGRVNAILDGGDCETGLESTVIAWVQNRHCSNQQGAWTILRPGAVTRDDLYSVLDSYFLHSQENVDQQMLLKSPGTRHPHYKPQAEVRLFTTAQELKNCQEFLNSGWALIALVSEAATKSSIHAERLYLTWKDLARRLYADFSELDEQNVPGILVQCPNEMHGIEEALRNRLLKASAH